MFHLNSLYPTSLNPQSWNDFGWHSHAGLHYLRSRSVIGGWLSRPTFYRGSSPCWLDKHRDGKSPNWQIATYRARQVIYRSNHTGLLDDAKAHIHAYVEEQRSKRRQLADEAKAIPLLVTYWKERGAKAINHDQAGRSIRTFNAFLLQDEAGANAVVTDHTPALFERFRKWRMGPHRFDIAWGEDRLCNPGRGGSDRPTQYQLYSGWRVSRRKQHEYPALAAHWRY